MPGFKQIKDKNHDTCFFGRHRGFSFTFFIYANNEPKSALAHDLGDCCDNKGKLAKRVFTCLPGLVLFICFQRKQLLYAAKKSGKLRHKEWQKMFKTKIGQ